MLLVPLLFDLLCLLSSCLTNMLSATKKFSVFEVAEPSSLPSSFRTLSITATSPFIQGVTFMYVSNLEESTSFLQDILKLPLVLTQRPPEGVQDVCRIFAISPSAFVGIALSDSVSKKDTGINVDGCTITLVSDHVDLWALKLRAAGVPIEKGPVLNKRYNIYHIFFRDPDGHLFEIQQFRDPLWPITGDMNKTLRTQLVLKEKELLFHDIFKDTPFMKVGQGNLCNGEIVSLAELHLMFNLIQQDGGMVFGEKKTFVDLGSGVGKAVVAAALLHEFEFCKGIEIQEILYEESKRIQMEMSFSGLGYNIGKNTNIEFHFGSFLEVDSWISEGDVIFVNSTCFDVSLMENLVDNYFNHMKSGSYIITLTHSLIDRSNDLFKLVCERRLPMSWGEADFFLHLKQ